MKDSDLRQLRTLLNRARTEALGAIDCQMPADSVPDRIAIPILNRLEAKYIAIDDAFDAVLGLIPDPNPPRSADDSQLADLH